MKFSGKLLMYFRDGFKSVCNHIFMSFSSILVLIITLSFCAVAILFVINTNQFTQDLESEVQVYAEFKYGTTEEQIASVKERLDADPLIADHTFVDGASSRERTIINMADGNERLVELLEETPVEIPDVLHVTAVDIADLDEIRATLDEMDEIDFTRIPSEAADVLSRTTSAIRNVMVVFIVVLMVVAVFLIQNTIRVTIFARQEELSIMRLVGASIGHITIPFLIEGVVIGIIGSIIPILFVMIGYNLVYNASGGIFAINLFQLISPQPLIYTIGFSMGLISIVVSLLGSLVAVAKYAIRD